MNETEFLTSVSTARNAALTSFAVYMVAVVFLAWLSSRVAQGKQFIGEYFLGSRGLGMWAFALTFAATNASGGSFIGFPSLIYTHGWSLALWIASYMMVPLVTMGLLAKRINDVARRAGAVTVPEVMQERFGHSGVGLFATFFILLFMFFYLLAQFKAGSDILAVLLEDVPLYRQAVGGVAGWTANIGWSSAPEPDYLLCLVVFAVVVILYTSYGGFRAVVWTDVLQGIVMVIGVILLLFLTLRQVGGLNSATRSLGELTPPEMVQGIWNISTLEGDKRELRKGSWITFETEGRTRMARVAEHVVVENGKTSSDAFKLLVLTHESEEQRVGDREGNAIQQIDLVLAEKLPYAYGAGQKGVYLSAPGPSETKAGGFLSLGMAFSFFAFWAFGGAGQPSNMVRLMSFNHVGTLKRAIIMVVVYYSIIYFFLVVIFCCAKVLLPGMEIESDRVMPRLATEVTVSAGMPWLAGLLVAAPFAAVMSSVDSFLLLVSSALVRDIYQKRIRPEAPEKELRWLSYGVTLVVGIAAVAGALYPPKYLQDLIVFASTGLAACFLVPMGLGLYWRRMNAWGAIAGMCGGFLVHAILCAMNYVHHGKFTAYALLGIEPFLWDLLGSAVLAVGVALATPSPSKALIRKFFYRN